MEALSRDARHGTNVQITCNLKADEEKIYKYVEDFAKNKNRPEHEWNPFAPQHCRSFTYDAIGAGE